MQRPEALKKIKAVLQRVAPQAEVILFGSEARGEARPDSDFDLLILEETKVTYERLLEITGPLYTLLWEENINVSPIVMTRSEWYDRPIPTPFYLNVLKEGIRI
ncbi:MAG: nucleotidyltransferase domain-containing protein [Bacteroidales bacterium]|nr:nucleotidyltransferase domain-containing protein [Bacteroidales bacterium]